MADYVGTTGPDIVTVSSGDKFDGAGGDDVITILQGGTAWGGPGNDTLTAKSPFATVWYWSTPGSASILVDLQAGYANDGFGTRDTLVDVRTVHGFTRNGDQGYGSSGDDNFWCNPPALTTGKIVLDGRGGNDTLTLGLNNGLANGTLADSRLGTPKLTASADGREVLLTMSNFPNFVIQVKNFETISFWSSGIGRSAAVFSPIELIDLATVGPQVLLGSTKGWQTAALGTAKALTYSFMTSVPTHGGGDGGTGFTAFSAERQQVVRDIFAKLSQQTGLTFTEDTTGGGQLQFGINQQAATRGYSFNPSEVSDARAGDVWLDVETAAQLVPGQEGYYVLLHELGHALGLLHPLPQSNTSGATVLLNAWYDLGRTLMLSDAPAPAAWPSWYSAFDVQALRELYGTRTVAGDDDLYRLDDTAGRQFLSLLDDGGKDTLSAQASSTGASLDLRPGGSSSIGLTADGRAAVGNVVIGTGSWIENAVGTALDDLITGNSLNNRISGGGGNDIIDGQTGRDTAVFSQTMAKYTVQKSDYTGQWTVAAKDGESGFTELRNVERLKFSDNSLALDLDGAAGQVARILGALFGKSALSNTVYAGIGLALLDGGTSYPDLIGLALGTDLFKSLAGAGSGAVTNRQFVNLIYQNVIGSAPSAADLAYYAGQLDSGSFTQTTLARLACDLDQTAKLVNLVGLADTGLAYAEFNVGGA